MASETLIPPSVKEAKSILRKPIMTVVFPEDVPPLTAYIIALEMSSLDRHPVIEATRDSRNPEWVLLTQILDTEALEHINSLNKHRPHRATIYPSPEGYRTLTNFRGNPHFTALSRAYNGATAPNLDECWLWSDDTKASIDGWYSYNNAHRPRPEEYAKQSQPESFNGVILPTADTINKLVNQVVQMVRPPQPQEANAI